MKAIVYEQYGKPNVLQVKEVEPPSIKADELLIKVKASGINPVDTYFRKGIRKVDQLPYIPHFDLAGEVIGIGSEVKGFKSGDRIWATKAKGASAELAAVPAKLAFPLPKTMTYEEGAAIAMAFTTAHLSLFYRGQIQPGENVLVFGGAGAVGHAAIQLAKQAGATVITTTSTDEKKGIALKAGADRVINYRSENLVEQVMEITDGKGVSLILDVALSDNMEKDFQMIAIGGRIVTIGSPSNNTPPLLWRQLNMRNAALLGIFLFSVPQQELIKAGKAIAAGFEQGLLLAHVGQTFPFHEADKAHQALENRQYSGSIVLSHH